MYLIMLQWLAEDFLPYLKVFKESVKKRKGFYQKEKNMKSLSAETRKGLEVTGKCMHVNKML